MTNTIDPFGSDESQEPKTIEQNTQATPVETSQDTLVNRLALIKGENGEPKYRDIDTALDALKHSQEFIPTLQNENRNLVAELEALKKQVAESKAIEDALARRDTSQNSTSKTKDSEVTLSEEAVATLIQKQIESSRAQEQKAVNLQRVNKILTEAFGDKTQSVVKEVARDFNMTVERLREESSTNPDFVLKLFEGRGIVSTQPSVGNHSSSLNPNKSPQAPQFEKGATRGGIDNKELVEMWNKTGAYTKEKLGVKN